jgi:oligogalacturonide transport system permease protein
VRGLLFTALSLSDRKGEIMKKFAKRNVGLFFALPWLLGFILFKAYPFITSFYYSFTNYNLIRGVSETGLMNYKEIFTNQDILKAFVVTFKYAFMTVPLKLAFALFIAYILNYNLKGIKFFRTAYYIPSILGGSIAVAVLWNAIFQRNGIINNMLLNIGVTGPSWLGDERYALFIICLLRVWQFGSAMVIFLAALKGVPTDLYEAAAIDGAGKWRIFFRVTVPMITPVIFYNLITQLCTAFQEFNGPFIITKGGPNGATTLISLLVYNQAFKKYNMGMASAQAWLLFVVVAFFSAIAFLSQKKWVYYSDKEGR